MLRSVARVRGLAAALSLLPLLAAPVPAGAQGQPPSGGGFDTAAPPHSGPAAGQAQQVRRTYEQGELVSAGSAFFGQASSDLARAVEGVVSRFGAPNGYILGEEASGAFLGGLRYGEGVLNTQRMGRHTVFWQGPSFGWDFGGSGSKVMMLVYDLSSPDALMQRFTGVDGSAYLVGGLSITVLMADDMVLVPVRTGVGARLGVSIGYLKFTAQPTWNPF